MKMRSAWSERSAVSRSLPNSHPETNPGRIPDIDSTVGENYCSIQQLSSSRSAAGCINSSQESNLISFEQTGSPQQDPAQKQNQSLRGEEQTCWSFNNQPENSLQKLAAHASLPFTSAHTSKSNSRSIQSQFCHIFL